MPRKQSPGLTEALRARGLPKRRPSEDDRPPPSVLPGRKARVLPGQLSLTDEITTTERSKT
jgi:hypothetical protein